MKLLQEIKLTNVRPEKDPITGEEKLVDHFKQRREERLYNIEPTSVWNKLFTDLPQELDKSSVQREILEVIKNKVNENINKCAGIDTSKEVAAIIPVADLRIKKGDKTFILPIHSLEGDGSFFYIPVIKDQASTLMLVKDPNPSAWREEHFRSIKNKHKDVNINNSSQIPILNSFNSIIIVDYDSIVNTLLKQEKTIDTDISFNIKDLPYDPKSIGSSDYRPKSGGKELYLTINIPGEEKKKLKIKSGGVVNVETGLISKVELDSGSPGNALAFKMKLNNKVKNGFGMLQAESNGSTLILKDLYLPGAFDNKGNFIKTVKMVAENTVLLENVDENELQQIAEKYSEERNFGSITKILGSGHNGSSFLTDKNIVIKISLDREEYATAQDIAGSGINGEYTPAYYSFKKENPYYIIAMEEIAPIKLSFKQQEFLNKFRDALLRGIDEGKKKQSFKNFVINKISNENFSHILIGIVDCVYGLHKAGISNADIHEDNIGINKKGRVVMFDVISSNLL